MISKIFFALKKRIAEKVPGLKVYWYSEERLKQESDEPLYDVPSVHFEFRITNLETMTQGLQQGRLTIVAYVAGESLFEHEAQETMSKVIDYAETVQTALQLFAPKLSYLTDDAADTFTLFNGLHRTSITCEHKPTNLYITEMTYETVAYNIATQNQYEIRLPPLNIVLQVGFSE